MPKATPIYNAPDPNHAAAIAQMRAIAARSGDSLLLADGAPHPDFTLLDLCGEALECLLEANRQLAEFQATPGAFDDPEIRAMRARYNALIDRAKQLMRRAVKLRATTPAGILAKALLVRASKTGAGVLARNLADELVNCPAIRASLWPAQVVA